MSGTVWLACCALEARDDIARAVRSIEPHATIVYAKDAQALRTTLAVRVAGQASAVVGLTAEGVSDLNAAAAVVHDGKAKRVMLVGRNLSGSARSRAARAGVGIVVDLCQLAEGDANSAFGDDALADGVASPDDTNPVRVTNATVTSTEPCGEGQPNEAVARTGAEERRPEGAAPVIVVSSGRGGVGKTTVTALSALVARSWGMRVAVVDLDLACGNLFTLFGLPRCPAFERLRLSGAAKANAPATADALLTLGASLGEGVTLWGPCARPEMAEAASAAVRPLLDAASLSFDVVLVDTSATCTDAVAQAFQRCDRLLLVHDEQMGSVGSLARTSALAVRLGVARTRIVRVANHGDRRGRFDLTVGRAEVGLETARAFRLLEGGEEVGELLRSGHAADLAGLESEFVDSLAQMLAQLFDELGCLPADQRAQRALEQARGGGKRRFGILRRKAV